MKNYLTDGFFMLTESCNLNCSYCYVKKHANRTMPLSVAKHGVNYLIENAIKSGKRHINVTFFGGEPTLEMRLMNDIYDYAVLKCKEESVSVGFGLITNAMIFNDEVKSFLLKWKRDQGKINIQLSLDGNKDIESKNRPAMNGDFDSGEVMENNLEEMKEFFKINNINTSEEISVHSVITKESLNTLYDFYKYFIDKGFPNCWHFMFPDQDWDEDDINSYKDQLMGIYKLYMQFDGIQFIKNNRSFRRCGFENGDNHACSAGTTLCTFTYDGRIYPCHHMYEVDESSAIGKLNDDGSVYINEDKKSFYDNLGVKDFLGVTSCDSCEEDGCYICMAENMEFRDMATICPPRHCAITMAEKHIKDIIYNEIGDQMKDDNCANTNCNAVDDSIKKLISGIEQLSNVIADGFNQIEKQNNDILNLLIALSVKNVKENEK